MRLIDADKLPKYDGYALSANAVAQAVENAPTIEAEPIRHGHWMPYEFATDKRWRKCSVCGTADEYINNLGLEAIRRYCPFCGAKMNERITDEDNTRQ